MNILQEYYDGYNFTGSNLYAPQDILQFFRSNLEYENYWFNTGTPTYLIKLLEKYNYSIYNFQTDSIEKSKSELLAPYSVENLDLPVLLYQSGYLTITNKEKIGRKTYFTLNFPNISVRSSFFDILCGFLSTSKNN